MFYFYEDGHVTISMGILFKKELSTIKHENLFILFLSWSLRTFLII